jgi:hypothetical protein
LSTTDQSIGIKLILGLEYSEYEAIQTQIEAGGYSNTYLAFNNLLKGASYISEEGTAYQLLTVSVIGENSEDELIYNTLNNAFEITTLDNRCYFSENYAKNVIFQNRFKDVELKEVEALDNL